MTKRTNAYGRRSNSPRTTWKRLSGPHYQLTDADQIDKKYALLRKCHALSPNDPYAPRILGELSAAVGEKDLTEKWMQRAIDLETDPERQRMMECERMIFRRDFTGALIGLRQLPLELVTHDNTVLELVLACSVCVGDWPTVRRLASARLEKGPGSWELDWDSWALYYLALASRAAGRGGGTGKSGAGRGSVPRGIGERENNLLGPVLFGCRESVS